MSEVVDEVIIEEPVTPRLKTMYKEEILPELEKEFHHDNPMQIPRIEKVVVSMGAGAAARDSKLIEGAVRDLTAITGQKPKITKAKKSVAQFHLREGQAIGAYVTLRGDRMWEFLIVCLRWLCRVFAISVASTAISSMVRATTTSVSLSSPCSTRSIRTRSITSVAWTSPW